MIALEESSEDMESDHEPLSSKFPNKKTSIEENIFQKPNFDQKTINSTQMPVTIISEIMNTESQIEKTPGHCREGSLFTEILALKNIEIITDGVFEEGFEKINRLNSQIKIWKSELEITNGENLFQKPIIAEKKMVEPDKNMRCLFKSKQMIAMPVGEEKRIEEKRKKNELNHYEEFFILVKNCFFLLLS